MLPGMYVVHHGKVVQVVGITGPSSGPTWGKPSSIYTVQTVENVPARYELVDPMAVDIPLTPACPVCELPAGWQCCQWLGDHQGTVVSDGVRRVRPHTVVMEQRKVAAS